MSVLATLMAIAVSLAGFAHLAGTDPKRRRAFRLPDPAPRRPAVGWAAVLLPGFLVPVWAGAAGFFVWLGASSVLGWTIAAASPHRTASIRRATHDLRGSGSAVAWSRCCRPAAAGGPPCGGPGNRRSSSACASSSWRSRPSGRGW